MFLYRTKIKKMKICKIPLERGEDTEGHRDKIVDKQLGRKGALHSGLQGATFHCCGSVGVWQVQELEAGSHGTQSAEKGMLLLTLSVLLSLGSQGWWSPHLTQRLPHSHAVKFLDPVMVTNNKKLSRVVSLYMQDLIPSELQGTSTVVPRDHPLRYPHGHSCL